MAAKHIGEANRRHGLCHSAEYRSWQAMLTRVRNAKSGSAKNYIFRGITVCERWLKFENFLADMGQKPSPAHSLDRVDNSSGYDPENCRWALPAEQCRNQRSNVVIEHEGERLCVADWAAKLGVPAGTLYNRARRGWKGEQILFGR